MKFVDFESFVDDMAALLEGNGFEREQCFGVYATRAPDDADGFVKGKVAAVFFNTGEDIEMELLVDMRDNDWCLSNSVEIPESVAGDWKFQRFLWEMLEAAVDLEAL